jgi:thymidylate synthase
MNIPARKLGFRFMAAEAAWIIGGDNLVASIAPYSKQISEYSDDGIVFAGAYGPEVVSQLDYIVRTLAKDLESRQAVIELWKRNPKPSKDIPCTMTVQWLIRDGYIYCLDNMRSSDVWTGWPYDVFNFSMLTHVIRIMLRVRHKIEVKPGKLILTAGSQHIYEENWEAARVIMTGWHQGERTWGLTPSTTHLADTMISKPQLVAKLWDMAKTHGTLKWITGWNNAEEKIYEAPKQ